MSALMVGVLGIAAFIVLILLGMNIGLALLMVGFAGYAVVVNPTAAFALLRTDLAMAPTGQRFTWRERLRSLKGLIGVVVLFGTVLGGMFSGVFSVSQASAIGAFLAWVIMAVNLLLRREFSWKVLWEKTRDGMWTTIQTFAMTFLIIIGTDIFCKFLTITNIPMTLASYIGGLNVSRYVILALMTVVYLLLGMIMDELPMIMLTVPIFWPIAQALGSNYITEILYIPLFPFYLVEGLAMGVFTLTLLYDMVLCAIAIFRQDVAELIQADWS